MTAPLSDQAPHGRYDFVCDITSMVFGMSDKTVTLLPDFECEVEVSCTLSGGGFDLDLHCTDVLVDGVSLRNGDELARFICLQVQCKADEELENGGWLFEQVSKAEGLSLTGHPGDPDTHWQMDAAE